jgi:hypothetical protein
MSNNKSDRDINTQFDQKQFNTQFLDNNLKLDNDLKINNNPLMKNIDEINRNSSRRQISAQDYSSINILPHQRPIGDTIILMREMFYIILEMLIYKKNPLPFIFATIERQYIFSLFLIIIGSLLLLFSNLMISQTKEKLGILGI